ncbi:MAG: biotin--[acetyl-CoA-carboxylase] ligase [Myxococcales bacterium]|nr:biotin--[acetyl-CoA-carboxylase] ligase [Myxococcales bacterium]
MSPAPPQDLAPERIAPLLRSARYGRSLRVLPLTDSTNDDARADASDGAADGHVVLADGQRAGRGSSGRSWASPGGTDLYLSIVARPRLAFAQLPPLTLAVGLGVSDAVRAVLASDAGAPDAEVKWPNDVWLGGLKCAGILVEAESSGQAVGPVVIGIGLNVNRERWPEPLEGVATSLRRARGGEPLDRARVLSHVLQHVEAWVDRFVEHGGEPLASALQERLALRGREVTCGDQRGRLVGVAPSGAVRVETGGRVQELISGRIVPV